MFSISAANKRKLTCKSPILCTINFFVLPENELQKSSITEIANNENELLEILVVWLGKLFYTTAYKCTQYLRLTNEIANKYYKLSALLKESIYMYTTPSTIFTLIQNFKQSILLVFDQLHAALANKRMLYILSKTQV